MNPEQSGHHRQFPLRLPKSLRATAKELADKEGVSLNHFISLAVAEKISRVEHEAPTSPDNSGSGKHATIPQSNRAPELT
jgi:hypothetical protein